MPTTVYFNQAPRIKDVGDPSLTHHLLQNKSPNSLGLPCDLLITTNEDSCKVLRKSVNMLPQVCEHKY